MKTTTLRGRLWVLLDAAGRLIEDIDTDQIFHNAHLHLTEVAQMGAYALGNLEGWKDFSPRAKPGDIVVAGRNFGAGSSRQQAVDCFLALGVGTILAPSFSAIYFRNAVNSGFPVVRGAAVEDLVRAGELRTGDDLEVEAASGRGRNHSLGVDFALEPMSGVQLDIFRAGDLFKYGRERG
ncbi:MAG: 3-isopropylmalate dehydratase [Candidatus Aminicenantes bacterium]|nr:3-isopropylmalate dehydratase [Candidatus Aminicenantes bacterium]